MKGIKTNVEICFTSALTRIYTTESNVERKSFVHIPHFEF